MTALPPPDRGETPAPSLLRNILFHLSSRTVLVFLALLSTPILIHRLGTSTYGIYVLSVTIADLMAMLGVALIPAGVVLLGRSVHDEDWAACQRVVSTAFALFLTLGVVVGGVQAVLVPWLVRDVLRIAEEMQATAQLAFWLTTATFLLTIWAAVFNTIPIALERYDLLSRRLIAVSVANATLTIVYALLGGGVPGLIAINALTAGLNLVLLYRLSRALLPSVHFRPAFDGASLRALVRFGGFKFAGTVSGGIVFRVDQIIISTLLGVQALAVYSIPATVCLRLISLLGEVAGPVFPRVSKLGDDLAERRRLFLRASRVMVVVSAGVLIILAILGDVLLRLWIRGPEGDLIAREGVTVMRWLLAAFLIQSCASVAIIYCEALGRPEIPGLAAVLVALTWIPAAIWLTRTLGLPGPAVALFLVTVLYNIPFLLYASATQAGVRPWDVLNQVVGRPALAGLVTIGVGALIHPYLGSLASFALALLVLGVVFAVSARVFNALRPEDFLTLVALADRLPTGWPGRALVAKWGRRLAQEGRP